MAQYERRVISTRTTAGRGQVRKLWRTSSRFPRRQAFAGLWEYIRRPFARDGIRSLVVKSPPAGHYERRQEGPPREGDSGSFGVATLAGLAGVELASPARAQPPRWIEGAFTDRSM